MQKIRKELFPDIQYGSETICTNGEDSPLVRVLEKEEYKGKIVVSGEASIGKSTMLTDLRLRLLEKEKAYVYFNLRDLKAGEDDKNIITLINNYKEKDLIVILDSYDETSTSPDRYGNTQRKTAEDLIEYCAGNDKVALLVVGVRQGCKSTHEMRVEHGGFSATQGFQCNQENAEKQYLEFDKWAQERGFRIAKLQRFSDEKIDLILRERKGVSKELRKLLKNTMFLSMFLEDSVLDWESATNEAKFIDKYFEEVFCNKLEYQITEKEYRETIKEKLFSTICDIGENVFNGFCQLGSKEVQFLNYTELNTFFKQEQRGTEWIITATQEKYLSYCVAKYLTKRMPGETIKENEGIIQAISELCGKNESVREESLYFAGQLLDKNKICIVNDALHKTKNEHLFRSLSLILLGSNNGEIKYKKTAITRFSRFVFVNSIYLKTLTLPENIEYINIGICEGGDALKHIAISEDNKKYKSIDGNLYSKDGKELIRYAPGKQEEAFEIPLCVETIGTSAFTRCKYIKKITIPGSVKVIDRGAFSGCESLEEVVISEGVEAIMECAFDGCRSLSNIIIPASVKDIGWSAFDHCDLLSQIDVDESNDEYKSIDGNLYSKDGKELIRYAPGKQEEAFEIPLCVETIGTSAFTRCKYIKKITIPGSVKVIDCDAFSDCESLEEVVISEGVEAIMEYAFDGCRSLSNIIIPASVKDIGWRAFDDCDLLSEIAVDESNDTYKSIEGNLYSKDGSKLIQYAIGKTEKIFKIPSMVKSIEKGAFEGCESLENILIPNGVEQIGNYAIAKCKALRKIVIPSRVKSIGWYAFQGCNALENITIFNGVRFIDFGVFANCISLRSIIIPGSIKKIGTNAFAGCKSLEKVIILEGTEIIGKNAFDGCISLRSILIPRSVEYIEDLAFRECVTYTEEQRFRDIYISLLMSIYDEKQFKKYPFFKKIDIGNKTYYQCEDGNLYLDIEDFMCYKAVTAIYYGGTQKEWIEKKFYEQRELADAVIFFYREKQPNNKLGHYWHYDKDDNPVIWE